MLEHELKIFKNLIYDFKEELQRAKDCKLILNYMVFYHKEYISFKIDYNLPIITGPKVIQLREYFTEKFSNYNVQVCTFEEYIEIVIENYGGIRAASRRE